MPRKTKDAKVEETKKSEKTTTKSKTTTKKASTTKKNQAIEKIAVSKAKKQPTSTKKVTKTTAKKKTTSKKKKVEIVEYYDLPYRYHQTVVKVLAQTPDTLFIYWDISDSDRKAFEKQYGKNFFEITKPILIIHNTTLDYHFEVEINDFANSWYLHIADSKCDYTIELGRRPIHKTQNLTVDYIHVSSSNKIESPNDHVLYDKNQKMVYFKDVKSGEQTTKSLHFIRNMGKLYTIYDVYQTIYPEEEFLSNPSSLLK